MTAVTIMDPEPLRGAVQTNASPLTPLDMLNQAVERGADIAVMERLMALHERWEAANAKKAFNAALADAKAEIPAIVKNRAVDFTTAKGRTNYRYEDFAGVARIVDPILNKHGLSYRFRSAQANGRVSVTCILSHRDGYSEETTLEAAEDHSGNKNGVQAIGSSAQYLQRYTLKLSLGLATTNDDDGQSSGKAEDDYVTDEQADAITALLTETQANVGAFLQTFRVECVSDLRKSQYADAHGALLRKKSKQGAAQ